MYLFTLYQITLQVLLQCNNMFICVFVQQLTEVIIYQVKCICELTLLVKPEPEFRQTVVIDNLPSSLVLRIGKK